MPRRSHAKTRTGCATCKARRIKCKEERPECGNCIKHMVKCPGYPEVPSRPARSGKTRLASSDAPLDASTTDPNEETGYRSESPISPDSSRTSFPYTKPRDDLLKRDEWPGHWDDSMTILPHDYHQRASWAADSALRRSISIQSTQESFLPRLRSVPNADLADGGLTNEFERFLMQNFASALQLMPSLSFSIEADLWHNQLEVLASRFSSVKHAMLSFSATYTHFLTNNPDFSQVAIVHRGNALQALQSDMRRGRKDGIDAAIGSSILLADQAALEGDWKACVLHSRGLNNLCQQPDIKTSIFAGTRTPSPTLTQIFRAKYSIEAIMGTRDGQGCYTSLSSLQRFFSKMACVDLDDMPTLEFVGVDISPEGSRYYDQQAEFTFGGIGHLLCLAAKIHELHSRVEREVANMAEGAKTIRAAGVDGRFLHQDLSSELHAAILDLEQQARDWLDCAPTRLITRAFDADLPAIVLISYRLALDLLLHRCKLLLDPHLLPAPITVKAIKFVANAHQIVSSADPSAWDSEDLKLLVDCMNWPLWVLGWAEGFGDRQKALAVVQASVPCKFRSEYHPSHSLSSIPEPIHSDFQDQIP